MFIIFDTNEAIFNIEFWGCLILHTLCVGKNFGFRGQGDLQW